MTKSNKKTLSGLKETTAQTIIKELGQQGLSKKQIQAKHIFPLYSNLIRRSGGPDFGCISDILPNNSQSSLNKNHALWGVIVETREHASLEHAISNFIETTGAPVQLFHGKQNLDYILSTKIVELISENKVYLTHLNTDTLSARCYNALFLSKLFWENVLGRKKILVFQTDSILCRSSSYNINDFITFDYIGSKWPRSRPVGLVCDGGNGGLSLRDWSKSYDCLNRFPSEYWCAGEDGYFAFHIELIGGKIGRDNDCAKFCTQYEFLRNSFGAHKITSLQEKYKQKFLEYCPEARFILQ